MLSDHSRTVMSNPFILIRAVFPRIPPCAGLPRNSSRWSNGCHRESARPYGPAWFASNAPFEDAVSLLLWPDHYLLRMLMSVGVTLESLGIRPSDEAPVERTGGSFGALRRYYHVFRATPSRLWLEHVFGKYSN